MNLTIRICATAAFGLGIILAASADKPAAYYVSDGTKTDADGNAVWRPMTQEEFSDYIAEKYAGDYAGNVGEINQLQKDWEDARKEWNEKHPDDRQITSDEDDPNFDYGDDDSGDPNADHGENYQPTEEEIKKLLARKDLDSKEDSDDYGGIYEAKEGDGSEYSADIQKGAIDADKDDETTSRGLLDAATLEDANGNMVNKTFNLLSGGVSPGSHSIDGLFGSNARSNEDPPDSPVLLSLPFVSETDEEARKLVGYPITEREYSTAYGTKRIPKGWTKGRVLINGKKHNTYEIYRDVTRKVKGTIEDVEEPDDEEPDWEELPEAPENYLDEAQFSSFKWDFGGFKGGDAVWGGDPGNGSGPVIGNLKMGKDGLSFTYENGLAGWGLEKDDASALACLFVKDNDGNWVGGKFDWISTSRNTRDFENIYSGYNGWDLSNVPKTTTVAFVIVSKDRKWRSNVITAMWER